MTRQAEIFVRLYDEFGVMVVAEVSYEVLGGYSPATYHHPAEYPEIDVLSIDSIEIDENLYDAEPPMAAITDVVKRAVYGGKVNDQLWEDAERLEREDRECHMYDRWKAARYEDDPLW
jgi:hypothetical protein